MKGKRWKLCLVFPFYLRYSINDLREQSSVTPQSQGTSIISTETTFRDETPRDRVGVDVVGTLVGVRLLTLRPLPHQPFVLTH